MIPPWRVHLLPFAASLAFFLAQVGLHTATRSVASVKYLNHPPKYVEHFAFGFRLSAADSFWLRWIQDSDYCQTYGKTPVDLGTSKDEPITPDKDHLVFNPRHKICDDSWGFLMLDAITKLDPKFEMAYQGGAIMLSVLVEDYKGATTIFERGLEQFPNDWRLAYLASYHFLYDVQDLPRAAALLLRAGELGAPSWVASLASRLYTRSGQLELGLTTLENYKRTLDDEKKVAEVEKRILALRAEIQKQKGP